jgi:protein-S-isoprenylcysteine O-methyltransferase Ste14
VLTTVGVWWVFRTLGDKLSETVLMKRDHQLITTGPYRWVRHPLYTVGITLFLSIALVQASWLVLSTAVIAAVFIRRQVIPAEKHELLVKFSHRYGEYRRRTGRLLPRLGHFGR